MTLRQDITKRRRIVWSIFIGIGLAIRIALYVSSALYVSQGDDPIPKSSFILGRQPFNIVIAIFDLYAVWSFLFECIAFDSNYIMERFTKAYKFVRFIPIAAAQGVLFQLYIHGFRLGLMNRDPLHWLMIMMYFMFVPVIIVLLIMTIKMCCRDKSSHPLGDQLSDRYFSLLERSRHITLLTLLYFFTLLLVFYELYLQGMQDIKIRDSYYLLPLVCLVFAGLFLTVSVVICLTSKYMR